MEEKHSEESYSSKSKNTMAMEKCATNTFDVNKEDYASKLFAKLQRSIDAECGNWSKNMRKRNAYNAIALGLIGNKQEFYRMFPIIKTIKPCPSSNETTKITEWKNWCDEHCLGGGLNIKTLRRLYETQQMPTNKLKQKAYRVYRNTSQEAGIGLQKVAEIINEATREELLECWDGAAMKPAAVISLVAKKQKTAKAKSNSQTHSSSKERQRQYGMHSQITRKEWGSAYRPAHG